MISDEILDNYLSLPPPTRQDLTQSQKPDEIFDRFFNKFIQVGIKENVKRIGKTYLKQEVLLVIIRKSLPKHYFFRRECHELNLFHRMVKMQRPVLMSLRGTLSSLANLVLN